MEPGELSLDREYGGYGCSPTDPYFRTVFNHDWVAAKYMFVNVHNTSDIHNETCVFNELNALVRSTHDPLVYAEFITNGTLNFNEFLGPGTGLHISTTRGYVSYGSIGLGACILLPTLLGLVVMCLRFKRNDPNRDEKQHLVQKINETQKPKVANWESYLFPNSSFFAEDIQ